MEENKCCENCSYKKCSPLKVIGVLILLAVVFCIGPVVGPLNLTLKDSISKQQEDAQFGTGSVTVNVLPETTDTSTDNPPVLE